ncbi:synaptotagmin-like protein 3 [Centropristis striata]|uniref:synaptotagmin-like protein 3 n=1 Tax=Centropristis striata TaxID=184440 RepID=UPI0027E0CABC|nr:synaptotagmin-like protein 3 [Centropristis striata]
MTEEEVCVSSKGEGLRGEEEETGTKQKRVQQRQTERSGAAERVTHCSLNMDLSLLQALERERVLEVLRRDKQLRIIEEDRIRRMKHELQELRRRGAKSFARQYGERTCARCQRPLGKLWNSGAVCHGCSHRICSKCRVGVGAADWKCTVCHAYREVKFRSGEWFTEERAKRFPVTTDKYEMVGEKLLNTYNVLSYISVVPPTPPPHLDYPFLSRSGDLKNSKPFTKSVEDLMVSFTSHIRKISTSQNDVRGDLLSVEGRRRGSGFKYSSQKSLSDTDINKSSHLFKGPSLPNLFKKSKDSDQEGSSTGPEEETSFGSEYSGGKRGSSSSSISTDCSLFESISVAGELELALTYNSDTSCLEVTVSACRNLTYGDARRKKCHPYVKLHMLPGRSGKMKTAVKKNKTDPVYNEVLKFHIERHLLLGKRLQASVWHSGTLRRKVFLGEVLVPLDGWRFEDKHSQRFNWYPLCPKAESPEGGAVEQDGAEPLRLKLNSNNQGELLQLSSLKSLQENNTRRYII